jgi:hypothetical protein
MWPNHDTGCACVKQEYEYCGIQKYMKVYMQSTYLKCLI